MNYIFEQLKPAEKERLLKAPALVAVLVAGVDGEYNKREIENALELAFWKRIHARPDLQNYFDHVRPRIASDINGLMQELPSDTQERYTLLSNELEKLNPILQQMQQPIAEQLYASLRELARHTARVNGGILGYLSIGYNESKVITLPMINDPRTYRV